MTILSFFTTSSCVVCCVLCVVCCGATPRMDGWMRILDYARARWWTRMGALCRQTMTLDDDCPSCGHAHAPGSTCHQCGHYRRRSESLEATTATTTALAGSDVDKEPIVEVIDKFLCVGAFEHTSNIDVLIKCGIRTVVNVRFVACAMRAASRSRAAGVGGVM